MWSRLHGLAEETPPPLHPLNAGIILSTDGSGLPFFQVKNYGTFR